MTKVVDFPRKNVVKPEAVELVLPAKMLVAILQAFSVLRGERTVMLSWRIAKILNEVAKFHNLFASQVSQHLQEDGKTLKEGAQEAVELLLNEPITLEILPLRLSELSKLTVEDDNALATLLNLGVVIED